MYVSILQISVSQATTATQAVAVEADHHHTLFHPQMMTTNAIDYQSNSNYAPLGYGNCNPISRKRPRDVDALLSFVNAQNTNQFQTGEGICLQIQQQQLEIDHFVARHTEKVRIDVEERRKRNSRRIIAVIEEGISKRLREKEEQLVKITKLNWALEDKVKSLCVENQIWRELAQTNEAKANALRSNLKQVMEQLVYDEYRHRSTTLCVDEDAQSCCESNHEELIGQDYIVEDNSSNSSSNRLCKKCGHEESCVLLLPCRHLCLCTVCASSVVNCPLCKSINNISVHVNMS